MNRLVLVAGLLIVFFALVLFAAFDSGYQYKGSSFEPFPEAPDFALYDQFGHLFKLSDQRGKVVLLFFGYTHCPDVCPATLAEFSAIRADLGEEQAADVVFLFVTEDPDRDTPERLRNYLDAFDPTIIGLSGTIEDLQPVWDAYYVAREITTLDGEDLDDYSDEQVHDHPSEEGGEYLVLHTSRVYVIDKQGLLRLTFPYGLSLEDRVSDIEHLLSEE